jgi:hypothetical protein
MKAYLSKHEGIQWLLAIGLGAFGMFAGTVALAGVLHSAVKYC